MRGLRLLGVIAVWRFIGRPPEDESEAEKNGLAWWKLSAQCTLSKCTSGEELKRWEERTMLPTEENPSILHESPKGLRLSSEQGWKPVKREV